MFLIGEFSKLAQVSARLLRYYDELGLLVPEHTDSKTGYRSYSAAQLDRLNRILVLRDLGFSLEQIGPMVDRVLSAEELRGMLVLRHAEVQKELEAQEIRLRQLEHRLACMEGTSREGDQAVRVRSLPAMRMLSARVRVESFDAARSHVARVISGLPPLVPPRVLEQLTIISHAKEFEPDALDLEIGFVLDKAAPADLAAAFHGMSFRVSAHAPVESAAVSVRVGPPEVAHAAASAIARWVEAAGQRLDGPNREVFLRLPQPDGPPVVEMQFPLRQGGRAPAGA